MVLHGAAFATVGNFPVAINWTTKLRGFRVKVLSSAGDWNQQSTKVKYESLRVLEWDKLCDSVASYASTSLGREAIKAQLWSLDQSFQESLRLLQETNAAVRMRHHGSFSLDFTAVDLYLVQSALRRVRGSLPLAANEAMALLSLLQLTEVLQFNLKAAVKEDADWYERFMPLSQMIMELVVNRGLTSSIQQVMDEDGSVKDSASAALRKARDQVRSLERKLHQLLEGLIRSEMGETSSMQVCNFHGRWCIRLVADQPTSFKGLLLSSGPGTDSIIEPLPVVPSNDDLQQARAQAARAEEDVLMMLTKKMQMGVEDIEKILSSAIQLDMINARASFSLTFGGTSPDIFLPEDNDGSLVTQSNGHRNKLSNASHPKREWTLYLPKAYHPLLLQQHRKKLQKAQKDVRNAASEYRSKKFQGESAAGKGLGNPDLSSSESQVKSLEQACPVPVDFFIARKTRVVVITGPNTGGKTICLKTVGLAALMAKSGLYVLSSESAQIPWFDSVFADIGDEQSLSQSLSTFSGHLKQISDIKSQSTSLSLVLLDEVGAGTNPLEGAALGMSLLESFAKSGALLTIATTHHGELKTLKYSNDAFENACMEFDEENLKPTYKILWGVPGRSNAINIAKRLGLASVVVDNARALYGVTSAEIDEVITDMERFKQNYRELVHEARNSLMLARDLHEKLSVARSKLIDYSVDAQCKKTQELSEFAAAASSILRNKIRQLRTAALRNSKPDRALELTVPSDQEHLKAIEAKHSATTNNASFMPLPDVKTAHSEKSSKLPKAGDAVLVTSLGKKAMVLTVEPYKEEIVVQVGNMKMKLKPDDVTT